MISYQFASVVERKECADAVLLAANGEHAKSVWALRKRSMGEPARRALHDLHKREADRLRRAALVIECAPIAPLPQTAAVAGPSGETIRLEIQ